MQLRDRLRILREQSDLTQQQVSDKIKCGYSTYRIRPRGRFLWSFTRRSVGIVPGDYFLFYRKGN